LTRRGARFHRLCHDRREPGQHIDYQLCNRLAGVCVTYNGHSEGDTMWSAVCLLQRLLALRRDRGEPDRCQPHTRPGLPETELLVIAETESDFTVAIDVPKVAIARHRRFLEMLLEAGADVGERDG
jgi:hypothetical protein